MILIEVQSYWHQVYLVAAENEIYKYYSSRYNFSQAYKLWL